MFIRRVERQQVRFRSSILTTLSPLILIDRKMQHHDQYNESYNDNNKIAMYIASIDFVIDTTQYP